MASVLPQEISSLTVSELQQLDFSSLSLDEKVVVKIKGRPTPDIQITQPGVSNNKIYIRSFDSEWYQRKDWLCGCEIRSALFCFPCLLFGGDATWTKDGFRNINKMKEKTEKHEKSMKHIESVVSLSLLGGVDVKEKLSKAYRDSIIELNRKITKNRDILSKIIDCMTFCGNFETSMRDYDRINKHDSINSDVFRGLVNFASKLDPDLKNHLETSSVFNGVSKTIHNEILDCLLQIYREEIKLEIEEALFLAIMVDDVIEFSEHTQMVIVLRYVLKEEIIERFWGFFLPEDQTADGISKCILEQLDLILHGYRQKLVVQTIDGPNFMKGLKGKVQAKIKAVYENAHFIHCYAHPLNQIIRNAASVTRGSRIFFSNILAIPTFFSRSPQCVSIFNKHINSSVSHPSSEIWMNFTTRTVDEVHTNLQPLKCCLTEIQSTSNKDQTISEATGILHCLNDKEFVFWLELFCQIIPHVEEIYNEMQSPHIDAFKVHEYVYIFKTAIYIIKNSMYCENQSKILVSEAKELCDCLCVDLLERYSSFTKHLVAAGLLNKKDFTILKTKFPSEDIELTVEGYPMIDKEKLERELKVFYSRMELHEYGRLIDLLKFIMENNIDGVLSEIIKLIKILLTIPVTTSEPERCFSTLQRIKTFLRTTTTNEEKLDALAMISIENNFFDSHPNLKEKVIDLFAQHETRRMDFVLK